MSRLIDWVMSFFDKGPSACEVQDLIAQSVREHGPLEPGSIVYIGRARR